MTPDLDAKLREQAQQFADQAVLPLLHIKRPDLDRLDQNLVRAWEMSTLLVALSLDRPLTGSDIRKYCGQIATAAGKASEMAEMRLLMGGQGVAA